MELDQSIPVVKFIHQAIQAGVIDMTVAELNEQLSYLTPLEGEEYLQALWDRL